METPRHNAILFRIATHAVALLVISVVANVWQFFTPKAIAGTCDSFGSYSDILSSFHNGNRGLDGDGDGVPCENRK